MTARDQELLARSATLYLLLCTWLGIHRAAFVIAVAAILAVWIAACRRWPLAWVFTIGLIRGLLRR
jgi:hypothetical protein